MISPSSLSKAGLQCFFRFFTHWYFLSVMTVSRVKMSAITQMCWDKGIGHWHLSSSFIALGEKKIVTSLIKLHNYIERSEQCDDFFMPDTSLFVNAMHVWVVRWIIYKMWKNDEVWPFRWPSKMEDLSHSNWETLLISYLWKQLLLIFNDTYG